MKPRRKRLTVNRKAEESVRLAMIEEEKRKEEEKEKKVIKKKLDKKRVSYHPLLGLRKLRELYKSSR